MEYKECPCANCENIISVPKETECRDCRIWHEKWPDTTRPSVYWIISEGNEDGDNGEFGVEIDGVPFFYYKWPDAGPSEGTKYRRIEKREFGEVIRLPKP